MTMNVLFSLPDELAIDVITSWLPLIDIARLDSANLSCILRSAFLNLISGRIIDHGCDLPPLSLVRNIIYIRWIVARCIILTELTVPIDIMAEFDLWNLFLSRCVPRLRYVRVEEPIESRINLGPTILGKFLSFFVHHSRDLVKLTLRGDYKIPGPLLLAFSTNCPLLQVLDIQGKAEFSNWDMVNNNTQMLSLVSLSMVSSNLTNNEPSLLLDLCPNLEVLKLGRNYSIRQADVVGIWNCHAPLRIMKIEGAHPSWEARSDLVLVPVMRSRPELTEVSLHCSVSDAFLTALVENSSNLTHLSLEGNRLVTRAGILAVIGGCTLLTHLRIACCRHVSANIFQFIPHTVTLDYKEPHSWVF